MSTHSYPAMISMDDAIKWAERQPESTVRDAALSRLRYERDKAKPVKVRKSSGGFYTRYTCGECGATVDVFYKYCPNCGYRMEWHGVTR